MYIYKESERKNCIGNSLRALLIPFGSVCSMGTTLFFEAHRQQKFRLLLEAGYLNYTSYPFSTMLLPSSRQGSSQDDYEGFASEGTSRPGLWVAAQP